MLLQDVAACGARGSGLQICAGIGNGGQLQHGGKVSLQVFTVFPHQHGERLGMFRQCWNNTNIREC
ncbi:hypothetical protein JaAD80_28925 [Janthinobacterium sp. AD80]|nr:hypothetical protein JaAD80_28925 [Janthinobacterium sp. AD80]